MSCARGRLGAREARGEGQRACPGAVRGRLRVRLGGSSLSLLALSEQQGLSRGLGVEEPIGSAAG